MTQSPLLAQVELARPPTLGELYAAYAPCVMRWATRLLGGSQDAADVTQEVFLVVHRRLPDYVAGSAKLETWLFRITRNVVRARRRRLRVQAWLFGGRDDGHEAVALGPGPAEMLEAQADARVVAQVLNTLSETDRALLVLFELEGYSGEVVAEMLGLPSSVIWVRLHRARARFLSQLQRLAPEVLP